MFLHNILNSILIILALRIIKGSALTIPELNHQQSKDVVRQTKAEEILKFMNPKANVCEDFYEFACGNFDDYYPTETTKSNVDVIEEAVNEKIQLEMEADHELDSDVDKIMKQFYKTCIHSPAKGAEFMKTALSDLMPMMLGDKWQDLKFNWETFYTKIANGSGQYFILHFEALEDPTDNTKARVSLGEPSFALDRSVYLDASFSSEREQYVADMASKLHQYLDVDMELTQKTAKEMLDFEIALVRATIDWHLGKPFHELYSLIDIQDIQLKYSSAWDTQEMLKNIVGFVPDMLYVDQHYLDNVLNVLAVTPREVVSNYLLYKAITEVFYDPELSPEMRVDYCISSMRVNFYKPLMNLMYRRLFNEQILEDVTSMWQEIKTALENSFESSRFSWMHENTRKYALDKLRAMKFHILTYDGKIDVATYSKLNLTNDNHYKNMLAIHKLNCQLFREKFQHPFEEEPKVTSAPYYPMVRNTLNIPVDFLLEYYAWSNSYPYAYNFGYFGFYLAQEIVHAFDAEGRLYDTKGNMHDWWDKQTEDEYNTRSQCFANQYKSYVFGGHALPEGQSQVFNIADNAGVRLAYKAYMDWYEKTAENSLKEETFPGLDYSNKQLFFLSFAHGLCASTHSDFMANKIARYVHAPEHFRVIGALSNFDEFSKEFKCAQGTVMNPVKKCEIY